MDSKRLVAEGIRRLRTTVRARLAQPFTLTLVFVAAVLFGLWFTGRRPRAAAPLAAGATVAAAVSAAALLRAFLVRLAGRRLITLLQRFWSASRSH